MRTPRDLDGSRLIQRLRELGYEQTRQSGSHVRLTRQSDDGDHHVTVPLQPAPGRDAERDPRRHRRPPRHEQGRLDPARLLTAVRQNPPLQADTWRERSRLRWRRRILSSVSIVVPFAACG